jgi:general secretion pathway protein G
MGNNNRQIKGFTLVELLIVVIILAILAAIIVPQFSASTNDAKAAALQSNLANLRSAIEFYYQEHGEYPGQNIATGGSCPTGSTAVSAGAANSEEALIAQLTRYTNDDGLACTGKDATFKYGPYLKGAIPDNPEGTSNTITVVSAGVLGLATGSTGGWRYDTVTGEFIADN